ncbi:hypothetical protein F5148DRAFT_838557 [Russula earlei]|uniref:Uncharacterized protein n=1 Tax=Russula earlei TaxID=71964 RepID=A0ACC0UB31_9AGAM|nr:hypothetical protein F5148DRAFT_838557 [Russula earlei]
MRFPTNLVVLALATSTISPALSAPIRHNHARAHAEFEKRGGRLQLAETLFKSAKNMSPKSAKSFAPRIKSLFGSDVKEKSLSTLKWGGGMGLVGAGAQDISSHNKQAPHQRRALEPRAARAFAMEKRAGGAAGAGAKLVGSLLKNNKSWKQVVGQNALLGGLLSTFYPRRK